MSVVINLIPPAKKQQIRRHLLTLSVLKQEFLFSGVLLVIIFVLINLTIIARFKQTSGEEALKYLKQRPEMLQIQEYETAFSRVSEELDRVKQIQSIQYYHEAFLESFSALVPSAIKLTGLRIEERSVNVTGVANTREDLLAFQEILRQQEFASNVNIPLSDLVERQDIVFQLSFIINEEAVKSP